MKKTFMLTVAFLGIASCAMAQIGAPTSDVLGAHLNYGRGCAACHAPHGGAYGNGAAKTPQTTANQFLWGQDTTSLLGKSMIFSGNTVVTLPTTLSATTPDVNGVLLCMSCHDGNYAQGAMMRNQLYESLPAATYGSFNTVPTLLGNEGALGVGNYTGNHPVGLNAVVTCGGTNWDCTEANGVISMNGTNSSAFVQDYGFFVQLYPYNDTATVMCTSCHDQHSMNAFRVVNGQNTGLPSGIYITMFFVRGPYNPASTTAGSDQTAQFCRQCHGEQSNEMLGGLTMPSIF
jgi:hypothetical protein